MALIEVAKKDEIPEGTGKTVDLDGEPVAVFNVEGNFYAIHDTCRHAGGPLGEGFLEGKTVTCPLHGWQYDVTTGGVTFNPAIRVQTYKVKVEGDKILIEK